jgi:hypothetical protein
MTKIDAKEFVRSLPDDAQASWEPSEEVVRIIKEVDAANRAGARYTMKSIYNKLKRDYPELVRCHERTFSRRALAIVGRERWSV